MLKLLKKFTALEWALAILAIAFIVLMVFFDLTLPDYMAEITMLVKTEGSAMSDILVAGAKMLGCALGSLICSVAVALAASRIAANFSANLRKTLFGKVQNFSMKEIGEFSTASLITRSTNDVTQIQMLITLGLQVIVKAPITAVWAICKIAGKSWQWTMSTGIAVAVLIAVVAVCVLLSLPKFKRIQKLTDDINRITRENLTGLSVVRAYNAEDYQQEKFQKANDALTDTNLFANRVMVFLLPSIQIILSGLSLAVYWIGAAIINKASLADKMTLFSDMVIFSQYAVQVIMSFMLLVMVFVMLPRAEVAANRINEVLDKEISLKDGVAVSGAEERRGEVEFRNVSFSYSDSEENVIKNISFKAEKGETVAFIGATGSGKSTVVNLIPRFYDASEGEVFVDGLNVKDYKQSALRNKIGYISQKAVLFSGDVTSNIAYGESGKELSEEDVKWAVETAQASSFVENMEGGYSAAIAQRGENLSGGQKQRLSIARALARKPEILIFDDSFSALDYKTDRTLRKTLERECSDSTRLIVAQRIGTIRDADKIIVLDEGKIAGQGKHEELMENCEVYRQIAYSQLSKEELN